VLRPALAARVEYNPWHPSAALSATTPQSSMRQVILTHLVCMDDYADPRSENLRRIIIAAASASD
jgi:hypothetical protein